MPTVTNFPTFNTPQNRKSLTRTPKNQTPSASPPVSSTLILFPHYGTGTFLIPTTVKEGTEINLKWTGDEFLRIWGDKVDICLIALDAEKQMIERKENKELCCPDMQLILDITTLSSGEYHWLSSRHDNDFRSPPKSFKLSVRILDYLPYEGRSEWTGFISGATSNEFVIIPGREHQLQSKS